MKTPQYRYEIEQRLARRIVDGVAAWATFHQAGHPNAHYDEHLFYPAIREIAESRNWQAKQQQPLKRLAGAMGASKTVDFLIYRNSGTRRSPVVVVEVKYLRGQNPAQDLSYIQSDIDKLAKLTLSDFRTPPRLALVGRPIRFLLVIARREHLTKTIQCKSRKHADLVKMLKEAKSLKQSSVYRAKVESHLKQAHRWDVIAIGSGRWPR